MSKVSQKRVTSSQVTPNNNAKVSQHVSFSYTTQIEKPKTSKSDFVQDRLPLYGPLDVKSWPKYLQEYREIFADLYKKNCPFVVSLADFEVFTLLGKGAFGKVFLVKSRTDKAYYAMKAMEKTHLSKMKQVPHALNEKRILQSLDFPFAVRMEFFAKDNSYIYLFMPFITGGEMFNHLQKLGRFTENQSRFYAAQVVLGLEYLHHLRLVYRDLKPENLLIDHQGYLKITDFGFCKPVASRTYTFCGTPHYLAPEVISGHGYGTSCDWWSFGVLIYEMSAGSPPFDCDDQMTMFKLILSGRYSMPVHFPPAQRELINHLLQPDVTRRYGNLRRGAEDVKYHEWFRPISWLELLNRRVAAPFVPPRKSISEFAQHPSGDADSVLQISEQNECEDEFKDF